MRLRRRLNAATVSLPLGAVARTRSLMLAHKLKSNGIKSSE